ncbi:hypothetical protein BKA65DRAFT_109063 [Rhexocercosporidium sp. MPI-PUGE-AT-0058]|nr:hypothetical protein BKA65DRAFT_109063 [Rhexocercosporidium sp. MPI-PUGE-AT-0058]
MSNSGLPSPPLEDNKSHISRKMSKPSKSLNRSSKRSSPSHEHSSVVLDGRHKRVWKACERCRMKKTKCDGESPCKRCKDDGLVCTAGSRKKTEFKQLPRGYAEVLENTQYALIATVQKLYTMVRNGEQWDLGEPELNDRGQPVIHDIASKLGCIRASPDLPYAFPEGEQDFADLQVQLQSARSEMASEDNGSRKHSEDSSSYSPGLQRTDRASSSESDHSNLSKDYNQIIWAQRQAAAKIAPRKPAPLSIAQRPSYEEEPVYQPHPSLDTTCSMPSPIYTEYQTESPMFRNASPFSPWAGTDDFLGPAHALDLTAHYMRQQIQIPRSSPLVRHGGFDADALKAMQMNDGLNFADGTIRPNMLDCHTGYEIDQMDSIVFTGDYESQMGTA